MERRNAKRGESSRTLHRTPSTDLRGCCTNPNSTSFDPNFKLENGILSRSGWALVNDSFTDLVEGGTGDFDDGWISAKGRNENSADLFLFGCGLEFEACLTEFVQVSGRISVPTAKGLGIWWSRHWGDPFDGQPFGPMTAEAVMHDVVEGYINRSIPLDIVVLDMEWHTQTAWPKCETFLGIKGWGGYSWNRTLFPDPDRFIDSLKSLQIDVALNYHADGWIDACQTSYKSMAGALGVDPSSHKHLPDLDPSQRNKTYCDAYFTHAIEPLGAAIAWTDTPQATTWSNYLYVRYPAKKNKRTINFSRYGGIGDQRKPIGFSGDSLRKWDTLAYEVYMTPRAANVGFGWWSHDIGGFSGGYLNNTNHTETAELFLRWLQFASFSPIFRTHCRFCDQRIWTFGNEWFQHMKRPFLLRRKLFPYINTHSHLETYKKGRSLLVPTYWGKGAATEDDAYNSTYSFSQYLFGRSFLVAPVTKPQHESTTKQVWLPPGEWKEWGFREGKVWKGPARLTFENISLDDVPAFVNTSAIIPLSKDSPRSSPLVNPVEWNMFPTRTTAKLEGILFEDDGETMDYRKYGEDSGILTKVGCDYQHRSRRIDCILEGRLGSKFHKELAMHSKRVHMFRLADIAMYPQHVVCGNEILRPVRSSDADLSRSGYWFEDGPHLHIRCPPASIHGKLLSLTIRF